MASGEEDFALSKEALDDGIQVVAARGELDAATVGALNRLLSDAIAAGEGRLLVDLSEARYIDSSGLSALIAAGERTRRGGGRFAVLCAGSSILRRLEVTRVDSLIDVFTERDAALECLRRE